MEPDLESDSVLVHAGYNDCGTGPRRFGGSSRTSIRLARRSSESNGGDLGLASSPSSACFPPHPSFAPEREKVGDMRVVEKKRLKSFIYEWLNKNNWVTAEREQKRENQKRKRDRPVGQWENCGVPTLLPPQLPFVAAGKKNPLTFINLHESNNIVSSLPPSLSLPLQSSFSLHLCLSL